MLRPTADKATAEFWKMVPRLVMAYRQEIGAICFRLEITHTCYHLSEEA